MTDASGEPAFDLSGLLQQAQAMQQQLQEAQARVQEAEVEGVAGGGAVRIRATGGLEFRQVRIDPGAVDPAEVDLLEDLVLAALRDVVARANDLNAEALGPLGGLAGGLGGLPGGA